MHDHAHAHGPDWTLPRRGLIVGAAGALVSTGLVRSLGWSETAEAAEPDDSGDLPGSLQAVMPPPEPIPGGTQVPDGPLLHVFLPGPEDVTLPHSGLTLQGLNVEPSTITDYRGTTALAYLVGTATGSDGKTYDLEADIRAFEGTYLAADESRHSGRFAFI